MKSGWRLPALLLLLSCPGAYAGVEVNCYDDAVYLYLDKLHAAGLVRTYMPDQRPLARSTIARLVAEARRNAGSSGGAWDAMIVELEREFRDSAGDGGFRFEPLDSAALAWTATDQEEAPMPDNGLGGTAGRVQPLLSYQDGDRFDRRSNLYLRSVHTLQASPHFAAYLEPKLFVRAGGQSGVGLARGYVKTGYRNVELLAGRDDIRWGPGENGIFFSTNARARDMVKVSSPAPFRFPGFLRHAGHFRATAFVSRLGDDYGRSGATLSGYRLDYRPFRWVNIGFDHAVFLGGEGAKGPDFTTAVGSFIGFLSATVNDRANSNHLMGMDATVRVPQAMGMELYGKMLLEDTQAEKKYMIRSDAAWLWGVHFPKIDGAERLSLRAELVYTGQFPYRHGFYTDGFALDGKFLGYDAGSDTWSGTVTARYQFHLREFVQLRVRRLERSGDHYRMVYNSLGNNIDIEKDLNRPDEGRTLLRLGGQKTLSGPFHLYGEAGLDVKSNAGFVEGKSENDFAFQVRVVYAP